MGKWLVIGIVALGGLAASALLWQSADEPAQGGPGQETPEGVASLLGPQGRRGAQDDAPPPPSSPSSPPNLAAPLPLAPPLPPSAPRGDAVARNKGLALADAQGIGAASGGALSQVEQTLAMLTSTLALNELQRSRVRVHLQAQAVRDVAALAQLNAGQLWPQQLHQHSLVVAKTQASIRRELDAEQQPLYDAHLAQARAPAAAERSADSRESAPREGRFHQQLAGILAAHKAEAAASAASAARP